MSVVELRATDHRPGVAPEADRVEPEVEERAARPFEEGDPVPGGAEAQERAPGDQVHDVDGVRTHGVGDRQGQRGGVEPRVVTEYVSGK